MPSIYAKELEAQIKELEMRVSSGSGHDDTHDTLTRSVKTLYKWLQQLDERVDHLEFPRY